MVKVFIHSETIRSSNYDTTKSVLNSNWELLVDPRILEYCKKKNIEVLVETREIFDAGVIILNYYAIDPSPKDALILVMMKQVP